MLVGPSIVIRLSSKTQAGAEILFGDGHPDGVGEPLAERAGRDLDAGGVARFGVSRRRRPPLAEVPQVVELESVAGQEQQRVLQDRRVPVGEDEPVAIGPVRIGRIVLHHTAVEHVPERGPSMAIPRMSETAS